MNTDAVLRDFLLRIEHYQEKYQLLDEIKEKELSYMKIYNTGEKVVVHKHEGHIQSRIVYYLMNIHITPRTIYLTRVMQISSLTRIQLIYYTFKQLPRFAWWLDKPGGHVQIDRWYNVFVDYLYCLVFFFCCSRFSSHDNECTNTHTYATTSTVKVNTICPV